MKTLCLSLGMLLLVACCSAMPLALQYSTAPVPCCKAFSFYKVPVNLVSSIKETHISCMMKGFIVNTVKGRNICFSQTFSWAVKTYNRINNPEGSALPQ